MSHYKVIRLMKNSFERALRDFETAKVAKDHKAVKHFEQELRKYSRVLILEDDSGFGKIDEAQTVSKQGVGRHLRKALMELPDDWDMLYFVVHASEPTSKVSPRLCKLRSSWSLNAYAINYPMYAPLVEHLRKIEDPTVTRVLPVDNEISGIHHNYKVYAIYPAVVFSQAGPSYITDKDWPLWQDQPKRK